MIIVSFSKVLISHLLGQPILPHIKFKLSSKVIRLCQYLFVAFGVLASFIKFGKSAITRAAYNCYFDITELLLNAKVFEFSS
jgi:hypothetical protein